MNSSLFFALCVAVIAALYQVFQRQVGGVNSYLVAIIVSATAMTLGILLVFVGGKLTFMAIPQGKALWISLFLIGICAFGIDFFTSKAYNAGGSVSVIGPIITGGVVVFSGIFGVVLFKESLSLLKFIGIALIAFGAFLASWEK